jgi:signal peptidase I
MTRIKRIFADFSLFFSIRANPPDPRHPRSISQRKLKTILSGRRYYCMKTKNKADDSSSTAKVKNPSTKKASANHKDTGTKHKKNVFLEYIQVIAVAFALVFGFMRPFVVEAFKIPSASMEDTLLIGDRILVAKFIYGITVPFAKFHNFDISSEFQSDLDRGEMSQGIRQEFENNGITLSKNAGITIQVSSSKWLIGDTDKTYTILKKGGKLKVYKSLHILDINKPKIGDIFVFDPPEAAGKKQPFIKRIVGVSGDIIEVKDGNLYRNGSLIDGGNYVKRYLANPQSPQFMPPTVIPEGHVFAMGDNRDRSSDSRVWGFVPVENIKGQAFMVYWSWDKYGDGAGKVRFTRIGRILK